jgi:Flp pilus assembly protein TadG
MKLLTGLRKLGAKPMLELNPVAPLKRSHAKSWTVARLLRARLRRAQEGNAMVEIALVLPMLALLVLGLMSVATMFMNYLDLTEATGSGAQHLQLIRTSTTDPCQDTYLAITQAAPNLTPANLSLSFNLNGTRVSGDTCVGDASVLQAAQGMPVSVTATYPCNLTIYGVNYAPNGCTLSATQTEFEY